MTNPLPGRVQSNAPCPIDFDARFAGVRGAYPRGFAWDGVEQDGTIINALAKVFALALWQVDQSGCDLLPEFWCHGADQTLDLWNQDYGLPDECGINDLCAKVGAVGGQDCNYYDYLAQLAGITTFCCDDVDVEIQCGCWNLGCEQMPPPFALQDGGCDLGYLGLGCPAEKGGSDLGQGPLGDDCNIAGYYEQDATQTLDDYCTTDPQCQRWWPDQTGELITGCHTPLQMAEYTGTAWHWRYGLQSDDPIVSLGGYTVMGCWETGCDELCAPDISQILCWIARYKPAHTVAVPLWCDL